MRFVFSAKLWLWTARKESSAASWVFVTVPKDDSEDIRDGVERKAGFGSVKVVAQIGETRWKTSVFPDSESGCYVLPIKKAVRASEGIDTGDTAEVDIELLG